MSQVIDLKAFKKKKQEKNSSNSPKHIPSDFGDRLARIRTSLEKINNLMAELKKMSTTESSKR